MAKLFFSLKLWEAKTSIRVMNMLAEQAETNIVSALNDAALPGAVLEDEFEDYHEDDDGNVYRYTVPYFTCGSSSGYNSDEVKSKHKHLITQLTRRSAFLTMYGLFEYHVVECLDVMDKLSGEETDKKFKLVEDCHKRLTGSIGGKGIRSIDHLAAIRNIMAHNDGVVENYHSLANSTLKKSREIRAVNRAMNENAGITVNTFDEILMNDRFLMYVVGEFDRYVRELEAAVIYYQKASVNFG
ncbi:hypothetical protein [Enterobacter kobei]|uniref:hypothetical protein n=1 Tax=Enterobacter kobei TaxID=208224 RepID=UPI002074D526|nr:hypothetical protein [Enterobacter kobei]MCM7806365.1 hypothetical protein [Enterobacter kobei]